MDSAGSGGCSRMALLPGAGESKFNVLSSIFGYVFEMIKLSQWFIRKRFLDLVQRESH